MSKKYKCFVISPIDHEGSEIYEEYSDLLELIIKPALENWDMDVIRGDHRADSTIDDAVIRDVQDSDICICDISMPNSNVYYELGRREETGKPVLILKKKESGWTPLDLEKYRKAGILVEYSWEGRHGEKDAIDAIMPIVGKWMDEGLTVAGKSATLHDIAERLSQLDSRVERMCKKDKGKGGSPIPVPTPGQTTSDPSAMFKFALRNRNIPMAEAAMEQLQYRMEEMDFYDLIVEQVAAMGSAKAGSMLIEKAETFMDSSMSFRKKVEYLGCLVSYANRRDEEGDILELFEKLCVRLEELSEDGEPRDVVQIYNQKNRLYHGIYSNTDDTDWLDKAIVALQKGLSIYPTSFMYFNLATCYFAYMDGEGLVDEYREQAKNAIDQCMDMEKDEEPDEDHLAMAYRIYRKINDPRMDDFLDKLREINPIMAANEQARN